MVRTLLILLENLFQSLVFLILFFLFHGRWSSWPYNDYTRNYFLGFTIQLARFQVPGKSIVMFITFRLLYILQFFISSSAFFAFIWFSKKFIYQFAFLRINLYLNKFFFGNFFYKPRCQKQKIFFINIKIDHRPKIGLITIPHRRLPNVLTPDQIVSDENSISLIILYTGSKK